MPITVQDLVTPHLRSLLAGLSPEQRRALLGRLGQQLANDLKAHFAARESEGNQRGWPSSHFWAREVREQTALREYDESSATVGIASAKFAHKVTGGTIRPGPGRKALAIPLRPEVAGKLPRSNPIPGLFLVKRGPRAWLAAREGKALRIYWALVPSVTQQPDARALPPREQLQRSLEERAQKELGRILQQPH